jgi:hypothetical protein
MVTWVIRACAIFFTLALLFGSVSGASDNRQFRRYGQTVTAEPLTGYTETTTTKKRLGFQVSQTKSKSAKISFTTKDGRRITVNRNLPDSVFDQFAAGTPVLIEYLPSDPKSTRFAGESASPVTTAFFGLLTLAATIVFWKKM